jgi:hypothetical protein
MSSPKQITDEEVVRPNPGRSRRGRGMMGVMSGPNRLPQIVLIGSTLLGSWLGMQAVHEFGHVIGAWLTGGQVARVVLNPLTISRTDLAKNPHPLIVVWAGPLLGVGIPLAVWIAADRLPVPGWYVLRFFAGFCLVANGGYLAAGSIDRVGDCGDLLRYGTPIWLLWLFGAVTVPAGIALWHRLGEYFGLGPATSTVNAGVAYGTLCAAAILLIFGFAVGGD